MSYCPPQHRPWTDEEKALLADLVVDGCDQQEIAARLDRSLSAVQNKARKVLCPIDGNKPGWGKRPFGSRVYWTRERVEEGLRDFASNRRGQLPNSDHIYSQLKKGHSEWPVAQKVLEHFGSMANAWAAIGASPKRFTRSWNEWSEEDDEYLLEHAGEETLKVIAQHLGRTWSACKRRLYDLKAGPARDVPGWLSAAQVAKEYSCPLSRVDRLIASGKLPAFKVKGGHYWRINPIDAEHIRELLKAPKKHSYQGAPPDVGDYYKRYGIRRKVIDGKVTRVYVEASA